VHRGPLCEKVKHSAGVILGYRLLTPCVAFLSFSLQLPLP